MTETPCHCMMLRRAARRVSGRYDDALAPFGVNIAQFSLLRNIARMQPVSLSDLGERVALDRSTVGRNSRVLARMGLIAFGQGEDQREAVLSLSPRGSAILADSGPAWDAVQDEIERKLGATGLATLQQMLATL